MPDFGEIVAEPWYNRWNFNELLPFSERFCLGYFTELPQINVKNVININESKIKYELEQKVIEKIEKSGCDEAIVYKLSYTHLEIKCQLVLLPVWISAFKFKNRVYQVLVNGQTGEVVGDRPISKFKYILMWIFIIWGILYILFILALQNYWLLALHIATIITAIYIKKKNKDGKLNK